MDVMLYLLEHGANYNGKFEMTNCDPPSYTTFYVDILYILRLCIYPLNSKQYKDKIKVIYKFHPQDEGSCDAIA